MYYIFKHFIFFIKNYTCKQYFINLGFLTGIRGEIINKIKICNTYFYIRFLVFLIH